MTEKQHQPPAGVTFLAGLDRDLRTGLASEIRALWTHTSTALEGNTLTLGDTAFVLEEGLTVSGKPLKDHQEVIGHARAIDLVYGIIDQRRRVTADDLHQIHRAVQTEVVMDAFNPVGRWKVEPNGTTALLSSGATQWHDYARPEHVPALMEAWLEMLDVRFVETSRTRQERCSGSGPQPVSSGVSKMDIAERGPAASSTAQRSAPSGYRSNINTAPF